MWIGQVTGCPWSVCKALLKKRGDGIKAILPLGSAKARSGVAAAHLQRTHLLGYRVGPG
jgi:hypothetical protein